MKKIAKSAKARRSAATPPPGWNPRDSKAKRMAALMADTSIDAAVENMTVLTELPR